MSTKRASLSTYRRKPESITGEEITLSTGVVVSIREWGCPQFFTAMQEEGLDENLPEMAQNVKAIDRALSHWVIAYIWDGDEKIEDPEKIHEILTDPLMWKFRMEVVDEASKENRWLMNGTVVKNLPASSRRKKSGGESTQVKGSIGHA